MKLIRLILIISVMVFANVTPAFAIGHEGDAVFRDGVLFNLTWHAAMNDSVNLNTWVIQANGGSTPVGYYSWNDFLGGQTFVNPAQHKYGMTEIDCQNVLNFARQMANQRNIYYTTFDLMEHNATGSYIDYYNVTNLRCDGLVEFSYEYYSFPVMYDMNGLWDIGYIPSCFMHSLSRDPNMNPQQQWNVMDPHY